MRIDKLGEQKLIEKIIKSLGSFKKKVEVGPGDDSAIYFLNDNLRLIVTTDILIEDVHFWKDKISAEDLGYKSGAVNLSDIAAMAGEPLFMVVGLGLPGGMEEHYIDDFFAGLTEVCKKYQTELVGGDLAASEKIFISITVIGKSDGNYLKRSGAKPGESLWVTGKIGSSGAGLKILETENADCLKLEGNQDYLRRHLHPEPRIKEAQFLLAHGATSMIDISDGIIIDTLHICQASKVNAKVFLEKIPVKDNFYHDCHQMGWEPLRILSSGEDYELLFSGPDEKLSRARTEFKSLFQIDITPIGVFDQGNQGITVFGKNGKMLDREEYGYQHFKK